MVDGLKQAARKHFAQQHAAAAAAAPHKTHVGRNVSVSVCVCMRCVLLTTSRNLGSSTTENQLNGKV